MKSYAVLHVTPGGHHRREEIRASRFDLEFGILVFFDQQGNKQCAFKDWTRIDRLS